MTYRILVTDQIDPDGVALLAAEPEFVVEEVPTLPAGELLSRIGTYDGDSERASGAHTVEVRMSGGVRDISVAGVAHPGAVPRITRIGAFHVDVQLRETLLILTNKDVPGVIGRVGTLLGDRGVNIAEYHQARLAQGGEALAAVSVDSVIAESTRLALLQLADIHSATVVTFRGDRSES